MKLKILKELLPVILLVGVIIYLAGSFLFWSFDPRVWGEFPRFLCLFLLGFLIFVSFEVTNDKNKKQ